MEFLGNCGTDVLNWPDGMPDWNIIDNACSMLMNLKDIPRYLKEIGNRVKKAVGGRNWSCAEQLVKLFHCMSVLFARVIVNKGNKNPSQTVSGVFFMAMQKNWTCLA